MALNEPIVVNDGSAEQRENGSWMVAVIVLLTVVAGVFYHMSGNRGKSAGSYINADVNATTPSGAAPKPATPKPDAPKTETPPVGG